MRCTFTWACLKLEGYTFRSLVLILVFWLLEQLLCEDRILAEMLGCIGSRSQDLLEYDKISFQISSNTRQGNI